LDGIDDDDNDDEDDDGQSIKQRKNGNAIGGGGTSSDCAKTVSNIVDIIECMCCSCLGKQQEQQHLSKKGNCLTVDVNVISFTYHENGNKKHTDNHDKVDEHYFYISNHRACC
jgi:hypothetical protein